MSGAHPAELQGSIYTEENKTVGLVEYETTWFLLKLDFYRVRLNLSEPVLQNFHLSELWFVGLRCMFHPEGNTGCRKVSPSTWRLVQHRRRLHCAVQSAARLEGSVAAIAQPWQEAALFPWSPSTGNNCELHAAKEKENADGGEEDEERESDRSRGRARVNRQEGVVSKSVPLLMCVVSLPPGLHTLQILHSSYWISKSPDLPTYSSSSHHCGSYSCSLLCLSDFDSVTPTLMGTKRTLRRC